MIVTDFWFFSVALVGLIIGILVQKIIIVSVLVHRLIFSATPEPITYVPIQWHALNCISLFPATTF